MRARTFAPVAMAVALTGCSAPTLQEIAHIECANTVDLAFTRDGHVIAVAHPEAFTVYDIEAASVVREINLGAQPLDLAASPSRRSFAVALYDDLVFMLYDPEWERIPFKCIDKPTAVAVHSNSQTIAVAVGTTTPGENPIILKHTGTDSPEEEVCVTTGLFDAVAFAREGHDLFAGSSESSLEHMSIMQRVWRIDWPRGEFVAHDLNVRCRVTGVGVSPDNEVVHVGGTDGRIRVVNMETGEVLREYGAGNELCLVFAMSDDGLLSATGHGRDVALWLPPATPGGKQPPIIPLNREVFVYDAQSGKVVGHARCDGSVTAIAFSPDGRRLAVATHLSIQVYELPVEME